MSEMEAIRGIFLSSVVAIGLVIVPVVITKLWNRYVKGERKDVNSGAKFG